MPVYRMPVETSLVGMPDTAVNVWHFRTTDETLQPVGNPAAAAEIAAATTAIRNFYLDLAGQGPHPVGVLANGARVTATACTDVVSGEAITVNWNPVVVPDVGKKMPYSAALTLNWYSASATRRGRGRCFIGPLHQGVMDTDGTPVDAYLAQLRTSAQALIASSAGTNGWAIGVYGLEQPGGDRKAPHVLRDVVGLKVNDRFAWIHSRAR